MKPMRSHLALLPPFDFISDSSVALQELSHLSTNQN